ncbi:MAG: sulfite exporter TauE/SafE family protein [Proteobacteria bacterium]|nr:sulfite exporter TauE/SafE family protein [Pseudomonadota bacterium]
MSPETIVHIHIILLLVAIGTVGGFLSGLLGVGGGIVFVPALYFCLTSFAVDAEHAMRVAVGTSLSLVLITGASSAFWHHKKGSIEFSIIKSWWPSIVGGVAVGTYFASSVDGHALKQIFTVVTLFIAFYMALSKELPTEPQAHRVSKKMQRLVAALIASLSALIGIGGAMLNVPFMAYIGVPMRKAVGTGGALGFVISLPAMVGYILSGLPHMKELPPYSLGYINMLAVAVIIPISMLLSPVGVHVSHSMPRNILRRIFAVVLGIVSLRMFIVS